MTGIKQITIYTDGACFPNPGFGGWGVLILDGKERIEHHGGEPETTNNRMEMMAVIEALRRTEGHATIYTDSQYVRKGITKWIAGWKKNGWKTKGGGAVKNKDLWIEMEALMQNRLISMRWVKGHSGHEHNERADELAGIGRAAANPDAPMMPKGF